MEAGCVVEREDRSLRVSLPRALSMVNQVSPLSAQQACSDNYREVVVIIPALNERESISSVLDELPSVGMVIVVDNGSTDGTASVAVQHGAVVTFEPQRGYGAACQRGLTTLAVMISSGTATPPKVVAFIDADYSDYPNQLKRVIDPVLTGEADFVLGSRLLGTRQRGAMPAQSIWGNRFACVLLRLFWGARYSDLGPMRALRYRSLLDLEMADRGFGWTIEMQIKAAQARLTFVEVPVSYRKRIGSSKISGTLVGSVRAGYRILSTIVFYRLRPPIAR